MAMAMGLHIHSTNFPSLSVQSSLDSGSPILLPEIYDAIQPLNIDDQDISPSSAATPAPKPDGKSSDTSIQILLHDSLKLRMNVIQFINSQNWKPYQEALKLGGDLRNVCRRVASFFSNIPSQPTHDLHPIDFHRVFVDMQLRRYILFLYTPFMIQARQKPQYYYARKVCLEEAMIIASYADSLNLPNKDLDDISRLIIIGKGPFKGPSSLDITSALALEIISQLEETPGQPLGNGTQDPLNELTKASRAPLIRRLEHIHG